MSAHTPIWTFSERSDVALETIAAARPLADHLQTRLCALTLDDEADPLRVHGADEVLRMRGLSGPWQAGQLTAAVDQCTDAGGIVVIGGTRLGVEVASRLAQRRRIACGTHALSLEMDPDGSVRIERRCYGGRFVEHELLSSPCVVAVQARHFQPLDPRREECGERLVRDVECAAPRTAARFVRQHDRPRSRVDIEKASVIVAAGRGVRVREDLRLLDELAGLLGGEVAGSRPVVDDLQWLPENVKVGLSGRTVKPRMYVACGIAGLVEHIVGMRGARVVVAINSDPSAPIHDAADYSIVGDLYEILPALIEALKRSQAASTPGS